MAFLTQALAWKISSRLPTMGKSSSRSPRADARSAARNWVWNISGLARHSLSPRLPRKEFSSLGSARQGRALSPPISRVRSVTVFPFACLSTFRYTSYCSSSVGGAICSIYKNSVRNSPTKSYCSPGTDTSPEPMLIPIPMTFPSRVLPGLERYLASSLRLARNCSCIFRYLACCTSSGSRITSPDIASRAARIPWGIRSVAPWIPDIAGIWRLRARMAVWELVPPISVMIPLICARSREAISLGSRSLATRITSSFRERICCPSPP